MTLSSPFILANSALLSKLTLSTSAQWTTYFTGDMPRKRTLQSPDSSPPNSQKYGEELNASSGKMFISFHLLAGLIMPRNVVLHNVLPDRYNSFTASFYVLVCPMYLLLARNNNVLCIIGYSWISSSLFQVGLLLLLPHQVCHHRRRRHNGRHLRHSPSLQRGRGQGQALQRSARGAPASSSSDSVVLLLSSDSSNSDRRATSAAVVNRMSGLGNRGELATHRLREEGQGCAVP